MSKKLVPAAPPPADPSRSVLRMIWDTLVDQARWLVGVPMLVLACGAMVLWWNFLQLSRGLDGLVERTTARGEAELVDRYYLVEPSGVDDEPRHWGRVTSMRTVAIFDYSPAPGQRQRLYFWDWAHDWQHPTAFEESIPVLEPKFRFSRAVWRGETDPMFLQLQEDIDDPAHWMLRRRPQPLSWRQAIRFDPHHPAVAMLDSPAFVANRESLGDYFSGLAFGLVFFVGLAVYLLLRPAVALLLPDASDKQRYAVMAAICLSIPLWVPYAARLAPLISDQAAKMAAFLENEFGNDHHLGFVATPPLDEAELDIAHEWVWTWPSSRHVGTMGALQWPEVAAAPDNPVAAYDFVQTQLSQQLLALPPQALEQTLAAFEGPINVKVIELLVPALIELARGSSAEALPVPSLSQQRALALLQAYAAAGELPDVDVYLYRRRLETYRLLKALPELSATATARLEEAEARIAKQLAS